MEGGLDEDVVVLEGLSELRIESNLLLGILTEISLAPSTQLLPPLRDRLLAAEGRATKAVAKLEKTEHAAALKAALQALIALGSAKNGIPAERERETIKKTLDILEKAAGKRPTGWVTPIYGWGDNTLDYLAEAKLAWCSDALDASARSTSTHLITGRER